VPVDPKQKLSLEILFKYRQIRSPYLFWRNTDQLGNDSSVEPLDTTFVSVDLLDTVERTPVQDFSNDVAPLVL
jgi:hypothetical protein